MNRTNSMALILAGILAGSFQAGAAEPSAVETDGKNFETLRTKIMQAGTAASEENMITLLRLGERLGQPVEAAMTLRNYLLTHTSRSPELIRLAAENAVLCGDLKTAVGRYKQYLDLMKGKEPTPEISKAATDLYRLQIDFIGDYNGAFRLIATDAAPFRQSPAMGKFDTWFLNIAVERAKQEKRAPTEAAAHLARVFKDRLPLELERTYFWRYLDEMMEALYAEDQKNIYEPLPSYRVLVPLIREDPRRTAKYAFYVANLDFLAGAAGKEIANLERDYEAVIASAKAYLDAFPSEATLANIVWVMSNRHRDWTTCANQRKKFFIYAAGKLTPAERQSLLNWPIRLSVADAFTWMEIGILYPLDISTSAGARNLPLVSGLPWDVDPASKINTPEHYRKMMPYLQGVRSEAAAQLRALAAAGSDDAALGLKSMLDQDSWFLDFTSYYDSFQRCLWPSFSRMPRAATNQLPATAMGRAFIQFGRAAAGTPVVLFDARVARDTVTFTVQDGDKVTLPQVIASLAWVPWDAKTRTEVFTPGLNLLNTWAKTERTLKPEQRTVPDTKIDEWVKALGAAATSPASGAAPTPLCAALTKLVVAENSSNKAAFDQASREAYPLVSKWNETRSPFSLPALRYVLVSRVKGLDNLDVQCEALRQCLAEYTASPAAVERAGMVFSLIQANRDRWTDAPGAADCDILRKVNSVILQALLTNLDQNRFIPELYGWFWLLRAGGNSDWAFGTNLVDKIIEKKKAGAITNLPAASHLMYVVAQACPPEYAKKYPTESFFEEMAAADMTQAGALTPGFDYYNQSGKDIKGSLGTAAAQILMPYDAIPLGYGDGKMPCPREQIWFWYGKALSPPTDKKAIEALDQKLGTLFGTRRFDSIAVSRGLPSYDDLKAPQGRKAYMEKRVPAYLDRLAALPARLSLNVSFSPLVENTTAPFSDQEVALLIRLFKEYQLPQPDRAAGAVRWDADWALGQVIPALYAQLLAQGRQAELYSLLPYFWKFAGDRNNATLISQLAALARQNSDKELHGLALACSMAGLQVLEGAITGDQKEILNTVQNRGRRVLLRDVIPVPVDDPKYPVYKAQTEWYAGSVDTAWKLYSEKAEMVPKMLQELDPDFVIWLIQRNTAAENFEQAETLSKHMMQWADTHPLAVAPPTLANLMLAFAQISFTRMEYPQTRAHLQRIVANRDFEGTRAATDARVQIADIDRLTKNFDSAATLCGEIKRNGDSYAVKQADFVMAKIKFDQEEYAEARDILNDLMSRDADFDDAKLLNGKVLLKIRRYQDASDLEIGPSRQRRIVVPGLPLKVSLYDKNAEFASAVGAIELRSWTDSGDEEFIKLLPHGDIKRRFMAELQTELGPVKKGDQKLQVVGSDRIHYDFSARYKQTHNVTNTQPLFLTVASDAELSASSGKILSRQEEEQIRLTRLLGMERRKTDAMDALKLSEVRAADQIKSGNMINVRVIDPDRNLTAQKDALEISVVTSSGDSVPRLKLVESEPYSGIFEGQIQTASGQPTAFASDSAENRNPNFAVSFKNYPAWVGKAEVEGLNRMRWFTVDFNDNVRMGNMRIIAKEPNHRLKQFYVQIALQRDKWVTCGVWPGAWKSWDGTLEVRMMRKAPEIWAKAYNTETAEGFRGYLDRLADISQTPMVTLTNLAKATLALDKGGAVYTAPLGLTAPTDEVLIHLRGAFFIQQRKMRMFTVKRSDTKVLSEQEQKALPKNARYEPLYVFTIDGQGAQEGRGARKEELDPLTIQRVVSKGAHTMDLFVLASRDEKVAFDVLMDVNGTGMVSCTAGIFDPAREPRIREAVYLPPVAISTNAEGTGFDLPFSGANARAFRLALMDYEGDAPAINKILLQNPKGDRLLPTQYDFMDLRTNNVLEVLPGDQVTVSYKDPVTVSPDNSVHTASLRVTYTDAQISATFVEYVQQAGGVSVPTYIPMVRFQRNEPVNVFISDPDMDVSEKKDIVKFEARNSRGVKIDGDAIETLDHSGVFIGRILPVEAAPTRPFEIQCQEDDTLTLTYQDMENVNPGIPWARMVRIDSAFYVDPEVRVYDVFSVRLTNVTTVTVAQKPGTGASGKETFEVSRALLCRRIPDTLPARPVKGAAATATNAPAPAAVAPPPGLTNVPSYYMGGPLMMEVVWPTVVLSPLSKIRVYAQTSSGRAQSGKSLKDDEFDVSVPGTIMLEGPAGMVGSAVSDPQYSLTVAGDPDAVTPLEDGRFTFCIPTALGRQPTKSNVEFDPAMKITPLPADENNQLIVNGKDSIYLAFEYADKQGVTNCVTQKFQVKSDGFMDVLDKNSEKQIDGLYVGEKIYFRVVDRARDVSDEKDTVSVVLKTTSGKVVTNHLSETLEHTGQFLGFAKAVTLDEVATVSNVFDAVPCVYGDDVVATYRASSGEEEQGKVRIYKGADGSAQLFTKRFKDPTIAVKTQFAMAEAYFELAKKHRSLKEDDLAQREIRQGKKLLEEALRDFPDAGARDQAEYLLANLSFEFAEETADAKEKERLLIEAVSRFADIIASHMESPYAPKAQYKRALCYEKLNQMDQACEEYVKLAYTYPEHELIAETIARLGQYFWNKALVSKKKADELKAGGQEANILAAELEYQQARQTYLTSAEVFGRLSARFPNHKLAGQAKALSGQAYLQAQDYEKAIEAFASVMDQYKNNKELMPEAAYWSGQCYFLMNKMDKAYQSWKKLTWDYPESKWAKYARGRLTEPTMTAVAAQMEAE